MTHWEYSTLTAINTDRSYWLAPNGEIAERRVRWIVWLNELGRDGWEVAGYRENDCLLKRSIQ